MGDAFNRPPRQDRPGDLPLSPEARQVVDAISNLLRASVVLHDGEKDAHHHVARTPDRLSIPRGWFDEMPRWCRLESRINDRWTLNVFSFRTMLPDAESLVKWAAEKLTVHLPVRAADDDPAVPPAGGSGGSGGSAELGIPISWARKARS
jgi:hypothetical protein